MNIADILSPERVQVDVVVDSKQAVLETLAGLLASASPDIDAAAMLDSLLARERLGTTGLGGGIAIPHGRAPHATRAIGAFLRARRPVAYAASDRAPVDLFFALCVPATAATEHLALLAALAQRFDAAPLVSALRAAHTSADAYALLIAPPP